MALKVFSKTHHFSVFGVGIESFLFSNFIIVSFKLQKKVWNKALLCYHIFSFNILFQVFWLTFRLLLRLFNLLWIKPLSLNFHFMYLFSPIQGSLQILPLRFWSRWSYWTNHLWTQYWMLHSPAMTCRIFLSWKENTFYEEKIFRLTSLVSESWMLLQLNPIICFQWFFIFDILQTCWQ